MYMFLKHSLEFVQHQAHNALFQKAKVDVALQLKPSNQKATMMSNVLQMNHSNISNQDSISLF